MSYSNVLLIDDDEDDQEIFLLALRDVAATIRCTTLASARTALDLLDAGELPFDLIFLDLNMPVMTGQQFLSELQKRPIPNEIPIFILSTSSDPATVSLARQLGAQKFITKPDNFAELKKILHDILNQHEHT
ncbi:MAG TPA: response regulator [Puia sp.]|nr:response regulator [Puia sp.]